MISSSCCGDGGVDMLAVVDLERSVSATQACLDCFFDLCLPMNAGDGTIAVGRGKTNTESLRKELANITMSTELLRDMLIPVGFGKCSATRVPSLRGHRILPQGQHRKVRGHRGWDSGRRSTCCYQGDAVVHFSSSERTDSYRASSTCTRGGSRQTRMYRS
jgi:hypothetical protein